MTVARQHARGADPQDIDVVTLAHIQQQRLEPDRRRLRHPIPLVAVKHEAAGAQCIENHAHRAAATGRRSCSNRSKRRASGC